MKLKLSLLSMAVAMATSATAADNFTLDEAVVSASGHEQNVVDAPATITVISAEKLQKQRVKDIGEAVEGIAGVDVDRGKMGNALIRMRGMHNKYTGILVDGQRQDATKNISEYGLDSTGSFMPPLNQIERIEVIKGPASVLYGASAMGGVVNIVTKKYDDQLGGTLGINRTFQATGSYNDNWAVDGSVNIPLVEDHVSLRLYGRDYNNGGNNIMREDGWPSGFAPGEVDTYVYGGRLNYKVDDTHALWLDAEFNQEDGYVRSTGPKWISNRVWEKTTYSLNYEGNYDLGVLKAYVSYRDIDLGKSRNKYPLKYKDSNGKEHLVGPGHYGEWDRQGHLRETYYKSAANFTMPITVGAEGLINLTTGVEGEHYRKYDELNMHRIVATADHVSQNTYGLFAQAEYLINDMFSITAGGRYHYDTHFGSQFIPRGYLVFKPMDGVAIKGGVSAGYLLPDFTKTIAGERKITNAQSQKTAKQFGNPNLKPEKSLNYELSVMLQNADLGEVVLTGFITKFKDQLSSKTYRYADYPASAYPNGVFMDEIGVHCPTLATEDYSCSFDINLDKSETKGLELSLQTAEFAGFDFNLAYTFTKTEITAGSSKGKPVSDTPKHSLAARLNYTNGDFSAFIKSKSKLKAPNTSFKVNQNVYYDDYTIVDIGMSYSFLDMHRVSLQINNLFDKKFDYNDKEWKCNKGSCDWSYSYPFIDYEDRINVYAGYEMQF